MTFVNPEIAKKFECAICCDIYQDPVQIACEDHIFCKTCVDELKGQKRYFPCPICRTVCSSKIVTRVKFIARQIQELKVKCPNIIHNEQFVAVGNQNNKNKAPMRRSKRLIEKEQKGKENNSNNSNKHCGHKRSRLVMNPNDDDEFENNNNKKRKLNNKSSECKWIGDYSELNNHIKQCPLQLISCKYCSGSMLQKDLKQHYENCPRFPMKCTECNRKHISRSLMPVHIDKWCPMTLIHCKCKEEIKRKDIALHKQNECPESLIKCTFYRFGCMEKLKRKDEKNHIENAAHTHNHLVQIGNHHMKLVETVNELKGKIQVLENKNKALERKQMAEIRRVETSINAKINKLPMLKKPNDTGEYHIVYAHENGRLYSYDHDAYKVNWLNK